MRARHVLPVAVVALTACSGSHAMRHRPPGLRFVPVSRDLRAACAATARRVHYPVPCPTVVPAGLAASGGLGVVEAGRSRPDTAVSWRGWVVGSSVAGRDHLVLTASPHPLASYAKLVNGPAWYPKARVRPLRWQRIRGRRTRVVFVPAATNDGSAFANHLVLIWTTRGHTYGIGFHVVGGMRRTLRLDDTLARGIRLVG